MGNGICLFLVEKMGFYALGMGMEFIGKRTIENGIEIEQDNHLDDMGFVLLDAENWSKFGPGNGNSNPLHDLQYRSTYQLVILL
jgi:hypothetical protein